MEYYDTGFVCAYSDELRTIRLSLKSAQVANASGQTVESAKLDVRPEGCEHFSRCPNAGTAQCQEAIRNAHDLM